MTKQRLLEVAEQRAHGRLRWLQVYAPDLARDVRAGQFVMLRCAEPGAYDPYLRRALFIAASEPTLGQIALLYAPEGNIGLQWLAHARSGDTLDILGPFGRPFELGRQTKALFLIGEGPGLAALMFLAREVLARGGAATLLAGAAEAALLPPPFLLPGAIEYQSVAGTTTQLFGQPEITTTIAWADQLCAALPVSQVPLLRDTIRRGRIHFERSFASVLLDADIPCGIGACGVCALHIRKGTRLACVDGPVFALHDIIEGSRS